jgi:hypothetical protein
MIWSLARHPARRPLSWWHRPPAAQDDSSGTFCQNTISSPLLLSSRAPALAVQTLLSKAHWSGVKHEKTAWIETKKSAVARSDAACVRCNGVSPFRCMSAADMEVTTCALLSLMPCAHELEGRRYAAGTARLRPRLRACFGRARCRSPGAGGIRARYAPPLVDSLCMVTRKRRSVSWLSDVVVRRTRRMGFEAALIQCWDQGPRAHALPRLICLS